MRAKIQRSDNRPLANNWVKTSGHFKFCDFSSRQPTILLPTFERFCVGRSLLLLCARLIHLRVLLDFAGQVMSDSAVLSSSSAPSTRNASEDSATPARAQRGDRSAGKGRRRRAIAEQRRAEQQNWNHFLHERDEEVYVAPPRPSVNRRQLRRAARRVAHEDWEAGMQEEDEDNIDMALALSLSLLEPGNGNEAVRLARLSGSRPLDMSYESLVMLENVKCPAPATLVNSMTGHVFNKGANVLSGECVEELCTICQVEYKDEDSYMLLPCLHTFHDTCGSEWFLKHSKLCPMCKHDVTEKV